LLGDTVVDAVIPATQQLIDVYNQFRQTVIGIERIPREKIGRYGIVSGEKVSERIYKVDQLIEKPSQAQVASDFAIAGRYILTPEVYSMIEKVTPDKNNEIQLTEALQLLIQREGIYSYLFEGKRYDVGDKLDYLKTTVEFALKRDEFSQDFLKFLKEIVAAYDLTNKN